MIAQAIAEFPGTKRRFEYRGNYGGIQFVDDYAHHPSEIRVTLAAARGRLQNSSGLSSTLSEAAITPVHPGSEIKRVVAIFQPHRYSRTETLMEDLSLIHISEPTRPY